MVGRLRAACRVVLVGLAGLGTVQSAWSDDPARSRIAVTAQVAVIARIEGLETPAVVTISPEEAATGYVTARATLKVRSNAVGGYLLTLWPRAAWFNSVRVTGPGTAVELPGDGGSIVRSRETQGRPIDEVSLELTFRLRDGIPDGAYSWPVEFAVSPL